MPVFAYRSTSLAGEVSEGVIEAADSRTAVEKLKNMGLIPLAVTSPTDRVFGSRMRVHASKRDLMTFTAELSTLLGAGLPLDRSLHVISEISDRRGMKEMVQALLKSIRGGVSFSDALQKHPDIFPRLYVNMVRAGEAGGVLDAVLERLNEFLESSRELRDHVVSAMIYPTILAFTGGVSIVLLLTFVLPRFSVIFSELGTSLPASTQVLLTASELLKSYGWILLIALVAAVFLFRNSIASERGRYRWDALKLFLMEDVITKLETARFCRTLGTLLSSGVSLLQALNNAKDVIGNRVIARNVEVLSKGVKEGRGISDPLSKAGVFPPMALSMIAVGEETGQLDSMLMKVAVIYEKSLKQAVKRFMALLEPVLILVMGLIIGFIVISMLLAIFSISDIPL
ncbi:MAG: type II secretion system F family protein [Syntrophales bacterium]|jgi:general secretion pathway protein F|nr:type II secretion system F family protein [Syntrophales bacterium]